MPDVDTAGQAVDGRVAVALGAIQAGAAREHDVRNFEQGALSLQQLARSVAECSELVHAVVHDDVRRKILHQWQRHRRIEPYGVVVDALTLEQLRQHLLQDRNLVVVETGVRDRGMRSAYAHIGRGLTDLQRLVRGANDRFFEKEDAMAPGKASQYVLRTLENEVPPQVGEDDDRRGHESSRKYRDDAPGTLSGRRRPGLIFTWNLTRE